jgi:hypothetical protein
MERGLHTRAQSRNEWTPKNLVLHPEGIDLFAAQMIAQRYRVSFWMSLTLLSA